MILSLLCLSAITMTIIFSVLENKSHKCKFCDTQTTNPQKVCSRHYEH